MNDYQVDVLIDVPEGSVRDVSVGIGSSLFRMLPNRSCTCILITE